LGDGGNPEIEFAGYFFKSDGHVTSADFIQRFMLLIMRLLSIKNYAIHITYNVA